MIERYFVKKKGDAIPRRDRGRPRGASIESAILGKAIQLIASEGATGFTMAKVAEAADVNKTTLYRRWQTKEDLIAAALEQALEEIEIRIEDTGTFRGDLESALLSACDFIGSETGRALALATITAGSASSISDISQKKLIAKTGGPMADVIGRAIERGELRSDVSPLGLLSVMAGAILHRVFLEKSAPDREFIGTVLDIILDGIAPRD